MRKLECLALSLGALALAACGDDKPDVKDGFANLRAMHLVQGGPDFDIVLNMSAEATADDVSFSDSSDYKEVAIGTYALEVRAPAGEVLLSTNITLDNKRSYTFVIHGRPDGVIGQLLADDFEIPNGRIRTRLFNAAVGSGPMALYFLPEDNGAPQKLTGDVSYGEATESVELEDGNHLFGLDVNLDGIVDSTYDLPPVSDGTLANVYAVFDESGGLDLILQMNDGFTWDLDGEGGTGAQARLRAMHLISQGPALSLFTAGATVTTGLTFMQESAYVGVPSGTFDILVGESDASPLFTVMGAQFDAGSEYTLVLFGNAGSPSGNAIKDDRSGIPNDAVRVRMMHTAPDIGELDFWDLNSGGEPVMLFEDLDFGELSDVVDLAPGSYRLAVDVNNDSVFDAFFDTPALPAGQLVTFYAALDNGSPRLVSQMDSGIMSSGMISP